MFSIDFWKDTAERVIASAAGGALVPLTLDGADVLQNPQWQVYVGAALTTGLVSFLKALVASGLNNRDSASLVDLPGKHAAPES